ncbi:MAG TPA: VC0807 family protein [Umezawaea sp.]|nr:VC0807 family protein [Umezawaea sp.]
MSLTSPDQATTESREPAGPAVRALVGMLFLDIGLSVLAYFAAELLGASTYVALLVGTVVAGLRVLWVAVRQRRLDPFALFLLAMFGAGLALTFLTGDARFVLAKDSAMSGTAGLVLVVSCLVKRPIAFYAAQRFARSAGSAQHEEFQAGAATGAMRARWVRVSLVWGFSLLAEAGLRVAAIYLLPIGVAANLSQALMVAVYAGLLLWTVTTAKKSPTVAR